MTLFTIWFLLGSLLIIIGMMLSDRKSDTQSLPSSV